MRGSYAFSISGAEMHVETAPRFLTQCSVCSNYSTKLVRPGQTLTACAWLDSEHLFYFHNGRQQFYLCLKLSHKLFINDQFLIEVWLD